MVITMQGTWEELEIFWRKKIAEIDASGSSEDGCILNYGGSQS